MQNISFTCNISTSGDDISIQLEWFCMGCKLSMERNISTSHHREGAANFSGKNCLPQSNARYTVYVNT